MHVAFGQFSTALADDARVHAPPSAGAELIPFPAPNAVASIYGAGRQVNWAGIGGVALLHAGLFAALVSLDIMPTARAKKPPTVVEMIALPMDPPPAAAPPEQVELAEAKPVPTPIVSPPALVKTLSAPAPVLAAAQPALSAPSPIKAAAPQPALVAAPIQQGPVKAGDLSSKMIAFKAPKYPIESRKKKEQGTVVLNVLLNAAGSVESVSVSKSSGFSRLDRAALEAVRKWRWSPTVRDGEAVMVSGSVPIPFILQS